MKVTKRDDEVVSKVLCLLLVAYRGQKCHTPHSSTSRIFSLFMFRLLAPKSVCKRQLSCVMDSVDRLPVWAVVVREMSGGFSLSLSVHAWHDDRSTMSHYEAVSATA